ncbi:hypothetical protein LMG26858_04428 [Achromobacter anxifer]|uniref:HK97 gp10 family phage protein n=1 Tax=Achromobacter anxifer TaxID=1287737 RepID=A0A6S7EBN5_9BURK|nr:hypothetical protein [Achromobacter anxifer]CAB3904863.1 hypothetical protein LMG26858_04428 [Achromobacter anxifer]CAB5512050.1 hypothetical protein LMG26857_01339 [Achromobacter anxifer]
MKVEMRLRGVDDVMRTLQSLPAEVVSKRGGPVKTALARGARYLRDRAKENLRATIAQSGDESTGLLVQNVIASRGKPPIGSNGERYLVRVRQKTYARKGKEPVTTRKTAALKEYGSSHQPATPWLRPAVQQHGQRVIELVSADVVRQIEKVVAKARREGRL